MTRVVWLTDIHLNFLRPVQLDKFYQLVRSSEPDCVLISGDITEAPRLQYTLRHIESYLPYPVYFVLGNHDFYGASIDDVHTLVHDVTCSSQKLHWLNESGIVELAPGVALLGHDGWADGRYGNYTKSILMLNDYLAIRDFVGRTKVQRLEKLNELGDSAAQYVLEWLPKTLALYDRVFFMTHVPPFSESCWHEGQQLDADWLPHFASKAVGDALVKVMRDYPKKKLTVLCGHTHGQHEARILHNLQVLTGRAEYGQPEIQQLFDLT